MNRLVPSRRGFAFLVGWLIAAGLLAWAIWSFGHRQLGGFDHGALVDTAWRMASQQRPYQDFYLTTPIAFYLGAGLAFAVWGPSWSALVWVAVAFALLTFALLTISISSFAEPKVSIVLPLACELLAMGVTSYWWYNSITAITACVFIAASIAFARKPSSRCCVAMFALATFLLLMMKPNTAGLLGVLVVTILMSLPEARRQLVIALAASASALLVLLATLGISPLAVGHSYLEIARSRGLPSALYFTLDKPGEVYLTMPLLMLCILPLAASAKPVVQLLRDGPARRTQILLISGAGGLTGLLGMFTNSDSNLVVGIPLVLLSAASLLFWMSREGLLDERLSPWVVAAAVAAAAASLVGVTRLGIEASVGSQQIVWSLFLLFSGGLLSIAVMDGRAPLILRMAILIWVAGVALLVGGERLRVKYIGPGVFYSDGPLVEVPGVRFFDGLLGSPRLREVVGEMEVALDRYVRLPGQQVISVYFGPRLEFAYAAFGLPSPKHLPVWYHPGNSYPEAMKDTITQAYLAHDFDVSIFLRTGDGPDFTYLPAEIQRYITARYQRVEYPEIVVFTRGLR